MCHICYKTFTQEFKLQQLDEFFHNCTYNDIQKYNSTCLSFLYLILLDNTINYSDKKFIYKIYKSIKNDINLLYSIKSNSIDPDGIDIIFNNIDEYYKSKNNKYYIITNLLKKTFYVFSFILFMSTLYNLFINNSHSILYKCFYMKNFMTSFN